MSQKIISYFYEEHGATAAEYAIMISLIALVIIAAVTFLGLTTRNFFSQAGNEFANF